MPAREPFTHLCQLAATLRGEAQRADLHLHTTFSDGVWTPAEIVHRARQRGLVAVAITDHDTVAGVAAAQAATADSAALELIPGVEITCEFHGHELHLLGYFFRIGDAELRRALNNLQESRRERFWNMVDRLKSNGVTIDVQAARESGVVSESPGRMALATVLAKQGHAPTVQDAFRRYLRDHGEVALPKRMLPVDSAIALVHAAGGVTSWAHPPQDISLEQVQELAAMGLDALEAEYPSFAAKRSRHIRELARTVRLAITGGSDCHGPVPVKRAVGSFGIMRRELATLRQRAQR